VFDVAVMVIFGVLGYVLRKLDIPAAPIILTMILGPLMEKALRQSLEISGGELGIFFTRPISATTLAIAALFLVTSTIEIASQVVGQASQV